MGDPLLGADPVWRPRTSRVLHTYLWNRKALGALVVASPAILASLSSLAVGIAIDDRLSTLGKTRDAIATEIGQLDQFTKDFDAKELLRTSFLVGLTSTGAADPMKYALDKLYRLNAVGSLRRIAAAVYPADWKAQIADYDKLVSSNYGDPGAVQKLSDAENRLMGDALGRITSRQADLNRAVEQIERLQSRKSKLQSVLNGLMYVLTVVVFFVKTAD